MSSLLSWWNLQQHFTHSGCCLHVLQINHHHPLPNNSTVSDLSGYHPLAMMPIVMKCFEWLIMAHIKKPNSCHTGSPYDRYHSVCNAPGPDTPRKQWLLYQKAVSAFQFSIQHYCPRNFGGKKLLFLGLNIPLCHWVLDFLTNRPQIFRLHNRSSLIILKVYAHQDCVLNLLLYTLLTHDCMTKHLSNHIVKFANGSSPTTMSWPTEKRW